MELIGKVQVAKNKFIEYGYTEGVLEDPITFDDAWEKAYAVRAIDNADFGDEDGYNNAAVAVESDYFEVFLPHDFLEFHGIATDNAEEDRELLMKEAGNLATLFDMWEEGMVFDLVLKNEHGEEIERISPVSEDVNDYNVADIWKQCGGSDF